MNFPGKNRLRLSEDATNQMVATYVCGMLGTNVHILSVTMPSYGGDTTIEFTTDPAPVKVPMVSDSNSVSGILSAAKDGTVMPMEDPL